MENKTRRNFFKWTLTGIGAAAFLKTSDVYAKLACPQAAPTNAKVVKKLLDYNSKTAKRLKFVANAPDAKGEKKYKEGENCANCNFYKAPIENYGKCAMVANKYVPACGWCKSYKPMKKKA